MRIARLGVASPDTSNRSCGTDAAVLSVADGAQKGDFGADL